ncbi:MAG TPA: hydrogenase maturation protease [Acidobacteriaceae bacterium]|nr:hydrogenase maturation protease [Acidobacteriaceae bacterium]
MISSATKYSALLLACGNSMREDDGFALHLAEAASQRFPPTRLRILAAQQWTPEMAAEIALAEMVIFADASISTPPGQVVLTPINTAQTIQDATAGANRETHRLDPESLLAFTAAWYGHRPRRAYLLTAGAISLGYSQQISQNLLQVALPIALAYLEQLDV